MKLKRILAMVLCIAMVLSAMGTVAFAEETYVTATDITGEKTDLNYAVRFDVERLVESYTSITNPWKVEVFFKSNKTLTLDSRDNSADGYLSVHLPSMDGSMFVDSEWRNLPVGSMLNSNLVGATVEADTPFKVMEYYINDLGLGNKNGLNYYELIDGTYGYDGVECGLKLNKDIDDFSGEISLVIYQIATIDGVKQDVNHTPLARYTFGEVADEPEAVAKVGNTEYTTIDEAIAAWTNGTTLTLLSDVTLTDVVSLKSTEHHILDLGTYTMTAASDKNAFVIQACGTGSAEKSSITINADATNPGGINAGSKCVVYYKYADGGISGEDRPIIKINGGVFTGSTSSWGTAGIYTIGTAARKCATLNISGGTFNCSINGSGKSKLIISGGTFHYSVGSQGDSTALRLISGGTFKTLGFMTADSNNTKFWIGTSMGNSNVGAYIDDNGYLVVGGSVITEAGESFEASSPNHGNAGFGSYLTYSSVATEGIYYTSVEEALADNNKTTGSVTVYVEELDMTNINYKGTIVVPEGQTLKVTNAPENLTVKDINGNILEANSNGIFGAADEPEADASVIVEGVDVVINPVDGKTDSYEITLADGETWTDADSVTMTFPAVEGATDGDSAYIVHEHEGANYIYVGKVADGSVTITNTVGFSTFTVYDGGLQEALKTASAMTGNVTVEIYDKVTLNQSLSGDYSSIKFVGKDADAEIYLDVQGYIEAIGKTVSFEDLTLSKSTSDYIYNAGFMNVAFGVYQAASVNYTDCTFANGAYASKGTNTFTGCTFKRSHDKYGLWAYGDVEVVVDNCKFDDYRGIKMYAEGAAKTVDLTVKNTDFSAVTDKPAIVLTYGESVTLEGNTYSSTGVFELDLDGAPNGTPVTGADVKNATCVNDNGACGVLVDGKIYTTVAQAAEIAAEGSTVILLHNSTEMVELAKGVNLDKNGYTADSVTVKKSVVAKIGNVEYATLQEALAAAQPGDEVVLMADVAGDIEVPAGITFNGNGFAVTGTFKALGDITFAGHTKIGVFDFEYTETTFNIGVGACLEIIGTGRMVIGHGCIFNIEGNIADAKTASVTELTPSLIMPGASFTGAGVTFNVKNAYIKTTASYCSSSKSASGVFDFNIENSIWEQYGKLAFESQSTAATVNFNLKDSVLTTTSHLVFGVSKGEIVIDNSNVNVGTSNQIENQSTMTIKNGSVVNGAVATSSNAKNPGTITVENATYAVTGQFSGSDLGTGKLIIKKNAIVSVGSIVDKANIVIDATDMSAGDNINFTGNLSKFTGTVDVINNDALEAKIVDGKIVLIDKPVAKIGDVEYETLEDAVKAAVDGDTITLLSDIELKGTISTNKSITIDGNNHKITPAKDFAADGNSAALVFANGESDYNSNINCAVKNVTFEGFNGLTRVVRANFCNATIENCIFKNNSVSGDLGGVITSSYATVNVKDCTFDTNTTKFAIINIGSDVSAGTDLIASITGNTFDGNSAETAVVFVASSANMTGNSFNGNIHTGENANAAAILAGPYTGNMSYTININENAFVNAMSKGETALPAVFAEDWSSLGSTTAFDLSSNYWNGNAPAEGYATSGENPDVTLDDYYTTYDNNTLGGLVTIAPAPITNVAKIGDVGYISLADAVAAAKDGEEITLLADITDCVGIKVESGKKNTLDLNGYTISGTCVSSQQYMFIVANGATMTIKDSSETQTGKITYAGNNSTGWIVDVEGKLVLESGTLELTGTWSIGYAVDVRPNAWGTAYTEETSFVMNGGKIVSSDGAVRVASSSADNYDNIAASFTMNGGEIEAAWDGVFVQQSNAVWDVLNVTVNGGTIKSALNPIRFYGPAATSYVNGEDCVDIKLNGGTLTYTGTETQTWLVENIIRLGGGVTADDFMKDSSVIASTAFAHANVEEGYKWVESNGVYTLEKEETANPFKDAPLFLAGVPNDIVDGVTYHPVYIATSIDSLNYKKVGFDYIFQIFDPETGNVTFTAPYTTETSEVYSSISDATTTYTVEEIGGNGAYLFMNKLWFDAEYYHNDNTKITITPYAYDMNGNKITGWTFDMTNEYYKSLQTGDVKQDMFKEDAESDKSVKVTSAEELLDVLENTTEKVVIDATDVSVEITEVMANGTSASYELPAGVTIKGATFIPTHRGGNYIMMGAGANDQIVFENCVFDNAGKNLVIGTNADGPDSVIYNNCTFTGSVITNFVDNPDGVAEFNGCIFNKATSGIISRSYVEGMGGTHNFNNCTFDYTGVTQSSMGVISSGCVNVYSETEYSTTVVLNGCTRINCGTRTYGPNSSLITK